MPWLVLLVCGLLFCSLAAAAPWDGAWLEQATSARPLITTFYYPSWPGVQILGLANHDDAELALLRPAFDPLISVDNGGDFGPWAEEKGLKTLLHIGHEYGASVCGQCTLSEADKAALPDWAELKLDGTPTSRTCLANPALYDLLAKRLEVIKQRLQTADSQAVVGVYLESEPSMGAWLEVEELGGNPHTVALFQQWLSEKYPSLEAFSEAAGQPFANWGAILPSDDNWLVRVWMHRFRPWLTQVHYQGQLARRAKAEMPDLPLVSRWVDAAGFSPRYDTDWSYWPEVPVDVCGITCYPQESTFLGSVAMETSFAAAYGRPVALTEFGKKRGERFFTPTPDEVRCVIWRALSEPVGLWTLFSWAIPGDSGGCSLYSEGALLRETSNLRADLDLLQPKTRLGASHKPFAIIVSRNAFWLPDADDAFYGGVLRQLIALMDTPEGDLFDVMEEHSPRALALLETNPYEAVWVVDACAEPEGVIKQLQSRLAPLVVLEYPRGFDPLFTPATGKLAFSEQLAVQREVDLPEVSGALKLAWTLPAGEVIERRGKQLRLEGLPVGLADWQQLVKYVCRITGVKQPNVHLQQFERGAVLVNWRTEGTKVELEKALVPASGTPWAFRKGCPWLCYRETEQGFELQGIRLEPFEVEGLASLAGQPTPHLELLGGQPGFTQFELLDPALRARFTVVEAGEVRLRLVPKGKTVWHDWNTGPFAWKLELAAGGEVASGEGPDLAFDIKPGNYLLTVTNTGPKLP